MDWDIEELNKIISIETKEKRSHKQQDKWTKFNCENCGKEKEELTSHYIKKKDTFVAINVFKNIERKMIGIAERHFCPINKINRA